MLQRSKSKTVNGFVYASSFKKARVAVGIQKIIFRLSFKCLVNNFMPKHFKIVI